MNINQHWEQYTPLISNEFRINYSNSNKGQRNNYNHYHINENRYQMVSLNNQYNTVFN